MRATEVLAGLGLTSGTAVASSSARFPDGAHYRVEIPSVEGPEVLRAVLDAAAGTASRSTGCRRAAAPC